MTGEQATKASEDLAYEIKRLRTTALWLASGELHTKDKQDAVLESFLLHARNLYEFLYVRPNPNFPKDLKPELYGIDRQRWCKERPPICPEGLKDRLDKRLAHISAKRLELEREFDVGGIYDHLNAAFAKFLELAVPDLLCPDLQGLRKKGGPNDRNILGLSPISTDWDEEQVSG